MQRDANLPEHGYVRVHYKKALHDPDDDTKTEPWHPVKYDEKGTMVTDEKGLFFMAAELQVNISEPAHAETWKHGDLGDAEGLVKRDVWKKKKVMEDILKHRMKDFTPEQKDQWRALGEFHDGYQCSDDVPTLPLTLRAGACSGPKHDLL